MITEYCSICDSKLKISNLEKYKLNTSKFNFANCDKNPIFSSRMHYHTRYNLDNKLIYIQFMHNKFIFEIDYINKTTEIMKIKENHYGKILVKVIINPFTFNENDLIFQ